MEACVYKRHLGGSFSAVTLPAYKKEKSHADEVVEASRKKYARTREEAERAPLYRSITEMLVQAKQTSLFS
jgi:hypothetical protein